MKEFKQKLALILIPSMLFVAVTTDFVFSDDVVPAVTEEASAAIVTGDATADTTIQNVVNTNTLETGNQTPATDSTDSPQGDIPDDSVLSSDVSGGDTPAVTEASETTSTPVTTESTNENEAEVANNAVSNADTGANVASNNSDNASIDTGSASAQANVLNVVNTNIFNSNGFFFILNNFLGNIGDIDVREMSVANDTLLSCGTSCNGTSTPLQTVISSNSTASITNDVIVRGATGGNTASDNSGEASINTGDAFAAANVVNVANTNIVDSNYMLLVFNNFGDWNGDLIFPNADFFASRFFGRPSIVLPASSESSDSGGTSSVSVDNTNEAIVENSASTTADTGDNEASGNGNGDIQTGNAVSQTTVHSTVNSNFFDSDSFVVLFKVYGNWSGNVFNSPKNISWNETPEGVSLYGNGEGEGGQASTTASAEGAVAATGGATSSLSVSGTNSAAIRNHVKVYALTGGNKANKNGRASIRSGNAYASTNVVNIANTNIVGRNWVFAIVNIFGDWNGNVSFGRPDLWVGSSVDVGRGALPRSNPVYRFTIANRGDADATHVKLKVHVDKPILTFNAGLSDTEWDIGTVPAGTSMEATYTANIASVMPYGQQEVTTSASVSSLENDGNLSDNNDVLAIAVNNPPPSHSRRAALDYTSDPVLTISKENRKPGWIFAGDPVEYQIVIDNRGGEAYHSVLVDTLKNEAGEVVNEQKWDLDTIQPNEQITVTYQTVFSASTTPGTYTNYARLETIGRHPSLDPFLGDYVNSNEASTSVLVLAMPEKNVDGVGGDMDIATSTELTLESLATSTPDFVSASTTPIGGIFADAEQDIERIVDAHVAPLGNTAFSSDPVNPEVRKNLLAASVGARPTANEIRFYLMLIIGAILLYRIYGGKWRLSGRFADFL